MSNPSHTRIHKMGVIASLWRQVMAALIQDASRLNPDGVILGLRQVLAGKFNPPPPKGKIVRVMAGTNLFIPALRGKRIISESELFDRVDNEYFQKFGLNRPGIRTKRAKIGIAQMTAKGTFADMFSSLPVPLGRAWLTQDQYLEFCAAYRAKLHPDLCNFVLLKVDDKKPATGDNLAVGYAHNTSSGFRADVRPFLSKTEREKPHYIIFRKSR
jgi:hypothetical protein